MHCCVSNCENTTVRRFEGISFHKFPEDKNLRLQWIRALRIRGFVPSYFRVCIEHFAPGDVYSYLNFKRLKKDAVPSISKYLTRTGLDYCVSQTLTSIKVTRPLNESRLVYGKKSKSTAENCEPRSCNSTPSTSEIINLDEKSDPTCEDLERITLTKCKIARFKRQIRLMNKRITKLKKSIKLNHRTSTKTSPGETSRNVTGKEKIEKLETSLISQIYSDWRISQHEKDERPSEFGAILSQLKHIINQNNIILEQNNEISNFINEKKSEEDKMDYTALLTLPELPLKTIQEFIWLNSEEGQVERQKLFNYLVLLGGSSLRGFLHSCMKRTMTDELVCQFTWFGEGSTEKLGDTKVISVFYEAAKRTLDESAQPLDINHFKKEMLEVLRSTKQRYRKPKDTTRTDKKEIKVKIEHEVS